MTPKEVIEEFIKYSREHGTYLSNMVWDETFSYRRLVPINDTRYNNLMNDFDAHIRRINGQSNTVSERP